jgi:hypothetical protein
MMRGQYRGSFVKVSHRKIAGENRRVLSYDEICLREGSFRQRVAIWVFWSGGSKRSSVLGPMSAMLGSEASKGRQSHLIPCGSSMGPTRGTAA